jgi:hypothetical protein
MAIHDIPRFRITTWPSSVRPPSEVAVPRFVGWAVSGQTSPLLPSTLEREASLSSITVQVGPDDGLDQRHRRERYGFDSEMARSLIADPRPRDGNWTLEILDAWDEEHRYQPHEKDLIGTARAWLGALGDCAMFAVNLVDGKPLPDEFALREFIRLDADDDAQLCAFVREWGPLEVPSIDYSNLPVTRDEQLSDADDVASVVAPFHGATDPDDALLWWRFCVSDVLAVLAGINEEDWQRCFISSNDSSCGDFGVSVNASPVRLQRAVMHLYQAVFETWLHLIKPQADGVPSPSHRDLDDNLSIDEIWRGHHLDYVPTLRGPHDQIQALEGASSLLNAGVQHLGPRVEIETLDAPRGRSIIGQVHPRITSALCMQVLAFISDGLPAKVCENETCGRYFVRQHGRSSYGQFRTTGVRFCSNLCARAQSQRQYRKRQRSTS